MIAAQSSSPAIWAVSGRPPEDLMRMDHTCATLPKKSCAIFATLDVATNVLWADSEFLYEASALRPSGVSVVSCVWASEKSLARGPRVWASELCPGSMVRACARVRTCVRVCGAVHVLLQNAQLHMATGH